MINETGIDGGGGGNDEGISERGDVLIEYKNKADRHKSRALTLAYCDTCLL